MLRPTPRSRSLLCALLAGASLPGQEWVDRSPRPLLTSAWAHGGMGGTPLLPRGQELFEWDGAGWEVRMPRPPGALSMFHFVFDPARERIVALTAPTPYWANAQTWEYDGSSWLLRGGAPQMQPGELHFDPARRRVMALCNVGNSTQDWLWDGSAWTALPPNVRPPGLVNQFAADDVRGRLVAYGGMHGPQAGQTWEWDGAQWLQMLTANAPPPRSRPLFDFDRASGRVLLFGGGAGGALADTWTWDGSVWTLHNAANAPGDANCQLAWDPRAGRTVAISYSSAFDAEWDGANWNRRNPSPPNGAGTYANDPVRRRLVRQQGNDTWEWDGTRWSLVNVNGPGTRFGAAMAFDLLNLTMILFGGAVSVPMGPVATAETWQWNGATWTLLQPANVPPARSNHVLLPHVASSGLILFGGQDTSGVPLRDTWLWSNGNWTDLTPGLTQSPPGGSCVGASGAITSEPMVLSDTQLWRWNGSWQLIDANAPPGSTRVLGRTPGTDHPVLASLVQGQRATHEFVQNAWVPRTAPPEYLYAMAWDPLRQLLLAFNQGDTYVFTTTPARETVIGSGCGVPAPRLVGAGVACVGNPDFRLDALVPPSAPVLAAAAFAPAQVALGGGCTQLLSAPTTIGVVPANAHGCASLPLPVPLLPALRGLVLHTQIATLQPNGPLGGLALSAALRIQVGD